MTPPSSPLPSRLLPVSSAREASRLAWSATRPRRWTLAASGLVFAIGGAAALVAPLALGRVVDEVARPDEGSRGAVLALAGAVLAATLLAGLATAVAVALLARVAEPALADLRERGLDRALHLDGATLEAAGTGDVLSRLGDDVRLLAESITVTVPLMVGSVVAIVFTSLGLFGLDWRLGLAGLGAVPFYVAGLRWYLPRSAPRYRLEREANGARAEALLTGIHSSRTLRAHGLGHHQQQRVDEASWRSAEISIDVWVLLTRFFARGNRAELVGLLLLLGTGFFLARAGQVSVGEVTAAALLFHRLFNPIGAVLTLFDEVQSAGASLTRLAGLALLLAPLAPHGVTAPVTTPVTTPAGAALSVRAVRHEYAGVPAVDGVDLELVPGERVAVVGASGAGKTTLGSVVAGRLSPTAGEVLVGGVGLGRIDRSTSAGARLPVALVSQEVHAFSGTVHDNLRLAAPDADGAVLDAALARIGASAWVSALPEGAETVVGEGATPLTGAQAQQVALARLVLADPLVAVLDEATAEAGSAGARDLEAAAAAATEGRTSLVVAHRLTQAQAADRVVVMDEGRIVEQGTHDELVAAGGAYAELWAAWRG